MNGNLETDPRDTALRLARSIEIDAGVRQVFSEWTRFENLPRILASVRRIQRIDRSRIVWDADVWGRQVVWEAEILERVPGKRIRWESIRGAPHAGEVTFEELAADRTKLTVDVTYEPRGWLERLGARLGLLGARVRRDLARFRRFVERRRPPDPNDGGS